MGVTQGGAMRFADLPVGANAAIGAQLRLRDIAALEATGPEGQKAAKEMKKDAASATIARANPAPTRHRPSRFAYLHRYINEMPVNPTDVNVPPNPPGFGQPGDQPAVSNALSGAVFPQPYATGDTTRPGAVNTLLGHYPPGGHQPTTHRLDRKTLNFLFQATNDPAALVKRAKARKRRAPAKRKQQPKIVYVSSSSEEEEEEQQKELFNTWRLY
jgi:hypothetical protein